MKKTVTRTTIPTSSSRARHLVDTTMFWSATGGGVHRYLMLKRLWLNGNTGWRHTIVAPGATGAGMIDCGGFPIPFSGGYRFPLRRAQAAALIAQQAPTLIEVGDPFRLAWSALDAAQHLGVPAVAFCHSNLVAMAARLASVGPSSRRVVRHSANTYLRHAYRPFDLVLTPSLAMASELESLGIQHVEHQALGVDNRVFSPLRRDPLWRRSLGLPDDARLLLYAGRFAPEKNLSVLVAAIDRLGPPYFLLAVGHGPMPPQGPRVKVMPYESNEIELARIYASVDGFVHAGDQETFGLSALEAMASGTPLVVRAAAGLGELVSDEVGIRVASSAPDQWAQAITELFGEARNSRIRNARLRAESLDWRHVMPGLLARYERLLAGQTSAVGRARRDAGLCAA